MNMFFNWNLYFDTIICTSQLFIEPELRTNRPRKKLIPSEPPEEHLYEPEGVGVMLKKGDEVRYTTFLSKPDASLTTRIGKSTMETHVLGVRLRFAPFTQKNKQISHCSIDQSANCFFY